MMNRRMFAAKIGALATALYAASQSIAKADDVSLPNADPLTPAWSQADWDAQGWAREPVPFEVATPLVITHSASYPFSITDVTCSSGGVDCRMRNGTVTTEYRWRLRSLPIEPNVRDSVRQKGAVA